MMVKKTKSRDLSGKLFGKFLLPIFILAVALAGVGGYWIADNIFGASDSNTVADGSRGAFSPPTDRKSSFKVNRPNPFTPWKAYEEKLPDDVYDPSHKTDGNFALAVPSIGDGSSPAWIKNSISYNYNGSGPLIAIVIDDMGVDRDRSKKIWQLPPPLTLAFLTYADEQPKQTRTARDGGHELMLHVSMEPGSQTVDPGPNVLMSGMDEDELRGLVSWSMDRFEGYIGINNHMGSRFTEDKDGMTIVMQEVQKRGLMFLDSRTSAKTVGSMVASEFGVPHLERNVFLDNEPKLPAINKQLAEVEALAMRRGIAIAIGHPREETINALAQWLPQARARGFQIVPLSAVLKKRLGINAKPN